MDYCTDGAAEIRIEDGVPIVPSIRPVIMVKGSDYDIGYQWFSQYAQVFGNWILEDMKKDMDANEMKTIGQFMDCIRDDTPEFTEMLHGMSDAANAAGVSLTREEILAEFCPACISPDAPKPGRITGENPDEDCSGFAAWGSCTKDGKLYAVGIGDMNKVKFEHTLIVFPENGNNFIISPFGAEKGKAGHAFGPLHPGFNNKGLCYVHHSNGISGNEPTKNEQVGIPHSISAMHTLRFADNCSGALKLLLGMQGAQRGFYTDVSGDAFCLECRDPLSVRRAGDHGERDFLYSTNNLHTLGLKDFQEKGTRYIEHLGWSRLTDFSAYSRNVQLYNMFHNYHGKVDAEFMKMVCRYAGDPPAFDTLEEAEAEYMPLRGLGWNSPVAQLTNEMVGVCVPDCGDNGTMQITSGCPARNAQPRSAKGYYFMAEQLHTFFEIKLASDPLSVCQAAYDKANFGMLKANTELRRLTYHDTAYAPLLVYFDKAVVEWTKGDRYMYLAGKVTGSRAYNLLGKALRSFCRSQAYANHVYEALVPPPSDPTDLGLAPMFNDDGQWLEMPDLNK